MHDLLPLLSNPSDALAIVLDAVRFGFVGHVRLLIASFSLGLFLAALCWVGAIHYTKLWNRRFRVTSWYHALCALAAVVTLAATVTYAGLDFLGDYSRARVRLWHAHLVTNVPWNTLTFAQAYRDVQSRSHIDTVRYPPPPIGSLIPVDAPQSQEIAAARYAAAALDDFRLHSPFLSRVLTPSTLNPRDSLRADLSRFFHQHPTSAYPTELATELVARRITADLIANTPRLVMGGRLILVLLFAAFQVIALGAIAYAAILDIRLHTWSPSSSPGMAR